MNNVNNTYYFVGQDTTTTGGSGLTDSFTGGSGGWNVAILPDPVKDYFNTTNNGVTTVLNIGDPAHAGTLILTNVQAIAFAPTVDPSGNAGTLEATGNALLISGRCRTAASPSALTTARRLGSRRRFRHRHL